MSRLLLLCASPTPYRTPVRRPTGWLGPTPSDYCFSAIWTIERGSPNCCAPSPCPRCVNGRGISTWRAAVTKRDSKRGPRPRSRPARHLPRLARPRERRGTVSSRAIFVLPSHAEGQAMALLEAMAHGLAIVTTPVRAHLEAVSPGRDPIIIQPGDVQRLGAELARLIDDPALRAQLGAAARHRFLRAFEIRDYALNLARLYTAALAGYPFSQKETLVARRHAPPAAIEPVP